MLLKRRAQLLAGILVLILVASCSLFVKYAENEFSYKERVESDKKKLSLVFSHNINGETHPCGCRHFPLGGLPQVAGLHSELKKKSEIVYVDTGDTFFPSITIPKSIRKSILFGAENLAKGLGDLKLTFFTPGDQDLAAGPEFLNKITKTFRMLIANQKEPGPLKAKKFGELQVNKNRFFFIGLVDPSLYPEKYRKHFISPEEGLKSAIALIEKNGYKRESQAHRLIILSHLGIDRDRVLAHKFPQINWIIGAHTQSFLRMPEVEGNTKIVQVLSRNHYVGEVRFDLLGNRNHDTYEIHEIRDALSKKLKPNPFTKFIDDHKAQMKAIQLKEQGTPITSTVTKQRTAKACMECHTDQGKHWQKTAHSIAFIGLVKAKEEHNLKCVNCHVQGLGQAGGPKNSKDLIHWQGKFSRSELSAKRKAYFDGLWKKLPPQKSARGLSKKQIEVKAKLWEKHDEENKVSHNFANIQCLNCHNQKEQHPFDFNKEAINYKKRQNELRSQCLNCHNSDQSPEWYDKGKVKEAYFQKQYTKISCPAQEN